MLVCLPVQCLCDDKVSAVLLLYLAKRLAAKNVSKMTYFVSSGMENLTVLVVIFTPVIHNFKRIVIYHNVIILKTS